MYIESAYINFGTDHGAADCQSRGGGDIFSYALAKVRNLPLLYKGDDFAHTDVLSALSAASHG